MGLMVVVLTSYDPETAFYSFLCEKRYDFAKYTRQYYWRHYIALPKSENH